MLLISSPMAVISRSNEQRFALPIRAVNFRGRAFQRGDMQINANECTRRIIPEVVDLSMFPAGYMSSIINRERVLFRLSTGAILLFLFFFVTHRSMIVRAHDSEFHRGFQSTEARRPIFFHFAARCILLLACNITLVFAKRATASVR